MPQPKTPARKTSKREKDLLIILNRLRGPGSNGRSESAVQASERLVAERQDAIRSLTNSAPQPSVGELNVMGRGIAEPSPLERAAQIQGHLSILESTAVSIQRKLFFEDRSDAPATPADAPLADLLANICTRTACMVGYLSTIDERLGTLTPAPPLLGGRPR